MSKFTYGKIPNSRYVRQNHRRRGDCYRVYGRLHGCTLKKTTLVLAERFCAWQSIYKNPGQPYATRSSRSPGAHGLLCRLLHFHYATHGGNIEALHNSSWPSNLHVVDLCFSTEAKVDAAIARRHETYTGGHVVIEHPAGSGGYRDGGANPVAIALASAQIEHDPVIFDQGIIHQDAGLLAEGGHHEIQVAIIVQVDKRRAALVADKGEIRSHLFCDINEGLAAIVFEHGVVLPGRLRQIVYISVRGIDIFPAVVVVVDEPDAPSREFRGSGPSLGRAR